MHESVEVRLDDSLTHAGCSCCELPCWWTHLDRVKVDLVAILPQPLNELAELFIFWWFFISCDKGDVVGHHCCHYDRQCLRQLQSQAVFQCWKPPLENAIRSFDAVSCWDLSGVEFPFGFSSRFDNRRQRVQATSISTVSDQVAITGTSFQHGSYLTIVKHSTVMHRTWPASNCVGDPPMTVTYQLNIHGEVAFQ